MHDPSVPEATPVASQQRVCQNCYEEVTAAVPSGLSASRTGSLERIFIDQRRLNIPSPTRAQSSSQLSDLAEYVPNAISVISIKQPKLNNYHRCPVCNISLSDLGPPHAQEGHVKHCLEGGTGTIPQAAKYLVYTLPAESALIGTECECIWMFPQNQIAHTFLDA